MADLQNVSLGTSWTITGNTPDEKLAASVVEVQAKGILSASDEYMLFARTAATADSVSDFGDFATGVYTIGNKMYPGTDYDLDNGPVVQRPGAYKTTVIMDQRITGNWMFESFDMSRFLSSTPDIRAQMMSAWTQSAVKNIQLTKEAVFLRGIAEYSKAMAYKRPENVLKLALPTTAEEARDIYNKINDLSIQWRTDFTATTFGINQDDVITVISLQMYNALTTTLPNFILNAETFKVFATGRMYQDKILGTTTRVHYLLNSTHKKGTEGQINKDLDFDLKGVHFMMYVRDNIAMPQGVQQSQFIQDNKTLNMKWIHKELIGLMEPLRPKYNAIGVDYDLTDDMVKASQALKYTGSKHDLSEAYQLAMFDLDFGTAPTVNKDGTITKADGTIVKNSAYVGAGKPATSAATAK